MSPPAWSPWTVGRWFARGAALLLFLFWGAFFVEHLAWFVHPAEFPPPYVVFLHLLHLTMLVGLLLGWRWERLGAVVVLGGALGFFSQAAGPNFPTYFAITAVPAVLWLGCSWFAPLDRAEAR